MSAVILQPVATPGTTQAPPLGGAPAGSPSAPSPLFTFLPFLILLPMFFLMFRRQKKEANARKALKKGDQIVTNAGIVGELMEFNDKFAKVKIAQGVTITVLAQVVAPLQETPNTAGASLAADKK